MIFTRRELSFLLPSLVLASKAHGDGAVLPSGCYPFDGLTAKTSPETHNQTRSVLNGETHAGVPLELHITTLAPGEMPHPPHQHIHEEMILVQKGTLEVSILGRSSQIGPGSVAYVRSNDLHGWKNVDSGPAQYFVLSVGKGNA